MMSTISDWSTFASANTSWLSGIGLKSLISTKRSGSWMLIDSPKSGLGFDSSSICRVYSIGLMLNNGTKVKDQQTNVLMSSYSGPFVTF
jgi:hypothetical protein